jgi:hypothetical protein
MLKYCGLLCFVVKVKKLKTYLAEANNKKTKEEID